MTQTETPSVVTLVLTYKHRKVRVNISLMDYLAILELAKKSRDSKKTYEGKSVDGLPFLIEIGRKCLALTSEEYTPRS